MEDAAAGELHPELRAVRTRDRRASRMGARADRPDDGRIRRAWAAPAPPALGRARLGRRPVAAPPGGGPPPRLQGGAGVGREGARARRFRGRETRMVEELIGRFRELGYGATGATSPGASRLSEDVLEQTVEDVLLRAFGTEFSRKGKKRSG